MGEKKTLRDTHTSKISTRCQELIRQDKKTRKKRNEESKPPKMTLQEFKPLRKELVEIRWSSGYFP